VEAVDRTLGHASFLRRGTIHSFNLMQNARRLFLNGAETQIDRPSNQSGDTRIDAPPPDRRCCGAPARFLSLLRIKQTSFASSSLIETPFRRPPPLLLPPFLFLRTLFIASPPRLRQFRVFPALISSISTSTWPPLTTYSGSGGSPFTRHARSNVPVKQHRKQRPVPPPHTHPSQPCPLPTNRVRHSLSVDSNSANSLAYP